MALELPLERCVFFGAHGYATASWHPFVQTLRSYGADTGLSYLDSPLARFYDRFRPADLLELYFSASFVEAHRDASLARISTSDVVPNAP